MHHKSVSSFSSSDSWIILSAMEERIRLKIETTGTLLRDWGININYGVKTGLNEAFILSGDKKEEIIAADPKSAEIIRPILRGKDIKRYEVNFADLWLIVTHNGIRSKSIPPIDIKNYPAVKTHLDNYYTDLARRYDKGDTPYNLRNCAYMDDFSKQRIVYREISDSMDACLVEPNYFVNNKCYMISGNHLIFLLSFFNSKLFHKIIFQQTNLTGGKGEAFVSSIRVPIPSNETERLLVNLYYSRNGASENELRKIEYKVDCIICNLYGLSDEETAYILSQ
jgi:adenine-specific DNA-methyltransferase